MASLRAIVSCVATLTVGGWLASSSTGLAVEANEAPSCVARTSTGEPYWLGDASPQLDSLADRLQDYANAHLDEVGAVAYCSDYSGLEVTVSTLAAYAAVKSLATQWDFPVYLRNVDFSMQSLLNSQESLLGDKEARSLISGSAPDALTGTLVLTKRSLKVTDASVIDQASIALEHDGSKARVREPVRSARNSRDRVNDLSWYSGAARLYWPLGNGTIGLASLGVPIVANGYKGALTAGHALASAFYNDGNVVGSTYASAYPGNAANYGDWRIIKGSGYAMRIWSSAGIYGTATTPIAGANYGATPMGKGMCASGSVGGKKCEYDANYSYMSEEIEGVEVSHLLETRRANGQGGGWVGGDSGGPCYYSNGSGGAIVPGIVSSTIEWWSTGYSYYCAQLSGVRAWNSGVYVGN